METVLQKKLDTFDTLKSIAEYIYDKRSAFRPKHLLKVNKTINFLLGYTTPDNPVDTKRKLILKQILYKGPDKGKAKPMSVLNNSNSIFNEMIQTLLLGMYFIDEAYMDILTIERRLAIIHSKNVYEEFVGHLTPKNLDVTLWMHMIFLQSEYELDFFMQIDLFRHSAAAVKKNWKYICMRTNFFIRHGLQCVDHRQKGCNICKIDITYMRTRIPCVDHEKINCTTCSSLSKYIINCITCDKCNKLGCKECTYTVMQPIHMNVKFKYINLAREQTVKLLANQGKSPTPLHIPNFNWSEYMSDPKNIGSVLKFILSCKSNEIISQKKDAPLTNFYTKLTDIEHYRLPVSGTSGRTVQYCVYCRSCTSNIIGQRGKCTNFINSDFDGVCSVCKNTTVTLKTYPFAYVPIKTLLREKKYKLAFMYLKYCICCEQLFYSKYQRDTCEHCQGTNELCYFTDPIKYNKWSAKTQYQLKQKNKCLAVRTINIIKRGNYVPIKVCNNHFHVLRHSQNPTLEFAQKYYCHKYIKKNKYG